MADAGGVTSIGSPGDGAEVCRTGGWRMGTVRAVVWPGSESLMKGLRCALSSVESMVGSPVHVSSSSCKRQGRAGMASGARIDLPEDRTNLIASRLIALETRDGWWWRKLSLSGRTQLPANRVQLSGAATSTSPRRAMQTA